MNYSELIFEMAGELVPGLYIMVILGFIFEYIGGLLFNKR